MAMLEDKQREQLAGILQNLPRQVKLVMFDKEKDCEHCRITRELLEEVAAVSDKLTVEVHDLEKEPEKAAAFKVDKVPAIVLLGEADYGIRFFGIPAGYEFTTLIEDIIMVSLRDHGLSAEILAELAKVDQPVHLEVVISPACPYCPSAVRAAHRLAMASEHIIADMVESSEFPELVQKYNVSGVPHTVINGNYSFVGPESELETAREVLRALGKLPPKPPPETADHHHHDHDDPKSSSGAKTSAAKKGRKNK